MQPFSHGFFFCFRRSSNQFSHTQFGNTPSVSTTDITAEPRDRTYDNIDRKVAYDQRTSSAVPTKARGEGMENPMYSQKQGQQSTQSDTGGYTTVNVKM